MLSRSEPLPTADDRRGPGIRGQVITTRSVPEHESLDFWREAVMATLVGMDVSTERPTIDAELRTDLLGDLRITTVHCDPCQIHRAPRFIARGDGGHVFVAVQSAGSSRVEQDGRSTELRPGDIGFFETLRPYRARFPQRFLLKVYAVPRSLLGISEEQLQQLTAQALRPTHGVPALVSPFLDRLADTSTFYDAAAAGRLAQSMTALLAATAAEHLGMEKAELPGADRELMFRIKTFIRCHLSEPDLSPRAIALAHGISVRYLHKLFGDEGTSVGRWVRELRLAECRSELAAGGPIASVGQIARRWGFSSSAHFGRVFRTAYGISPSEWVHQLVEPSVLGTTG